MTRNSAVFAVCLLLAVFLLLINKFTRRFISDVNGQIAYTNLPEGKVSVGPLPTELKLYVETTGMKLLWLKMSKPLKVNIDLAQVVRSNFVLSEDLRPAVAGQLPGDYKLIEIFPDTMFFQFDKSKTKMVRVVPNILISFKRQFDFTEPMLIKPDSVMITGPEHVVDTIEGWRTEKVVFETLDRSVQDELQLVRPPIEAIKLKPEKVRYTIAVEEYTEKALEIEISLVNVPKGKEISIYPKKIDAVFKIGLSNYEKVDASSFIAQADFTGVELGKSKYVIVNVTKYPSYIRSLDYSPKSVEYIVYK